ncbi:MAG: hypothetical protein VX181_07385, partial [Pseudomonadota bacterium]|nr:hypothetical protein [Pseudomonadota bacterium]
LLGGHDEPEILSYQIALFGPIGADGRQESGPHLEALDENYRKKLQFLKVRPCLGWRCEI